MPIRPMTSADIAAVLEIEQAVSDNPWTEKILTDCLLVNYHCWVLELSNQVVGFIIFFIAADECHLLNIAVAIQDQRQGYGRQLLEAMLTFAFAQQVKQILLEVRVSNTHAIKLYEQYGFTAGGIRKDYYKTIDGREDALLMTLNSKN